MGLGSRYVCREGTGGGCGMAKRAGEEGRIEGRGTLVVGRPLCSVSASSSSSSLQVPALRALSPSSSCSDTTPSQFQTDAA